MHPDFDPRAAHSVRLQQVGSVWEMEFIDSNANVLLKHDLRAKSTPTTDFLYAELRSLGLRVDGPGWSRWLPTEDGSEARGALVTIGHSTSAAASHAPPESELSSTTPGASKSSATTSKQEALRIGRGAAASLALATFGTATLLVAAAGANAGFYDGVRTTLLLTCIGLGIGLVFAKGAAWLTAVVPIAIVWNPIAPVYPPRSMWIGVDIVGAMLLAGVAIWALRQLIRAARST